MGRRRPGADEVHVWRIALDPPGACRRAVRGRPVAGRASPRGSIPDGPRPGAFIVGRGWLRTILGRYLGAEPGRLSSAYGPQGKPALAGDGATSLSVQPDPLARPGPARGRARAGGSGSTWRRSGRWPTPSGSSTGSSRPRERAEFRAPTRGRAARGLLPGLDPQGSVHQGDRRRARRCRSTGSTSPLAPASPPRCLRVEGRPDEAARWSLRDLDAGPGFAAALAVGGRAGAGGSERCVDGPRPGHSYRRASIGSSRDAFQAG